MQPTAAKTALVNAEEALGQATTLDDFRQLQETLATLASQIETYDPPYAFNLSPSDVLRQKAQTAMTIASNDGREALSRDTFDYDLWNLGDAKYADVAIDTSNVLGLVFFEVIEKLWRIVRANDGKPY